MAKKSTTSDTERLDDTHLEHVIKMLENPSEGSKAWTKKECCDYLGIKYNTTRLASILEKYKERKAYEAQKRSEKRGKPPTEAEIQYVISSYLEGSTVDSISKSLFRSPTFVSTILQKYGVPTRSIPHSYFRPKMIPEECMRDSFKVGERVYSSRYDSLAEIRSEYKPGVYLVYLLSDKQQQFAYQPACELASLEHIRALGVNV